MWSLTREEQIVFLFVAVVFLVGLGVKLRGMNLGSSLEDKEEIWIPEEKLNINRASQEQLVYLPGIGPVLA